MLVSDPLQKMVSHSPRLTMPSRAWVRLSSIVTGRWRGGVMQMSLTSLRSPWLWDGAPTLPRVPALVR